MNQIKTELKIAGPVFMYIGNLEPYQGIDLMLESFALLLKQIDQPALVIIGGQSWDIQRYQKKCSQLAIRKKVHFLGPKPLEHLRQYLSEADVLVSPRIKGINTPMKLYSYLHSGKPILATDLPTHTQLLDRGSAVLAEPSPGPFCRAMLQLVQDQHLRQKLGSSGKQIVEEQFTYAVFRDKLNTFLEWAEAESDSNRIKPV